MNVAGAKNVRDFYDRLRGEGYTRFIVSAVTDYLWHMCDGGAPVKPLVVLTWSAKDADDIRKRVRDEVASWCNGSPDEVMKLARFVSPDDKTHGIRAASIVDNHVVMELCREVDLQESHARTWQRRYEFQILHTDVIVAQWKSYVALLHAHIRKLEEERDIMQARFDEEGLGP